jgi:hypothetical protein
VVQEHPRCSTGIHVKVLDFEVNTSVRCWMHWASALEVFGFYILKPPVRRIKKASVMFHLP